MTGYDSRPDTWGHILAVQDRLARVITSLLRRSCEHDQSKLHEPERGVFDEYTPKLAASSYGSDEYRRFLEGMGEGLAHHYRHNSHHPEHFDDGIRGMSLLDVIEMLCDWDAAALRHADGDVLRSIEQNQERFGYSDELKAILVNTVHDLWRLGR